MTQWRHRAQAVDHNVMTGSLKLESKFLQFTRVCLPPLFVFPLPSVSWTVFSAWFNPGFIFHVSNLLGRIHDRVQSSFALVVMNSLVHVGYN